MIKALNQGLVGSFVSCSGVCVMHGNFYLFPFMPEASDIETRQPFLEALGWDS